jgi:predicted nucleotidyltransferase
MARTATTELLPIWRTDAQLAILHTLLAGKVDVTAASIAREFDLNRISVNVEVQRLEVAGLLTRRSIGRSKVLSLNSDHPGLDAIRVLVDLSIGPLVDLEALYEIDGVERVSVFGSWARRHRGERGILPRDIDVLIVGEPDTLSITQACLGLSGRYSIDVNPTIVTSAELGAERTTNLILDEIVAGPLVEVRRATKHRQVSRSSSDRQGQAKQRRRGN